MRTAIDLIVRPGEGVATLVYDDPSLEIYGLMVVLNELHARSNRGLVFIGHLMPDVLRDFLLCNSFVLVLMDGWTVSSTKEIELIGKNS